MDLRKSFEWALTALVISLVIMFVVIAIVKIARTLRGRRRDRLVRELRPIVIEAIETGAPLPLERDRRGVAEAVAVALLPKLRGEDRVALADLLDELGVIARARRGLRSRGVSRRVRSAQLLGAAGTVDAVPDLVMSLSDRHVEVRYAAVQALGRIGDPAAAGPLFTVLDDDQVSPHSVSMAMLRIGQSASDEIVDALASRSLRSRAVAAELVGILGVYGARRELESMLDDEPTVRDAAIRSLGRLGFPQSAVRLSAELEARLVDADADAITTIAVIIRALQSIGDDAVVPVIRSALTGPYRVAVEARRALIVLEGPGAVDVGDAVGRPCEDGFDRPESTLAGDTLEVFSPIPDLIAMPPVMTPPRDAASQSASCGSVGSGSVGSAGPHGAPADVPDAGSPC